MNNAARAALVLEREHLRFQKHPVWGIEAKPVTYDNMFVWKVSDNPNYGVIRSKEIFLRDNSTFPRRREFEA